MKQLQTRAAGLILLTSFIFLGFFVSDCYDEWLKAWTEAEAFFDVGMSECDAAHFGNTLCRTEVEIIFDVLLEDAVQAYEDCIANEDK